MLYSLQRKIVDFVHVDPYVWQTDENYELRITCLDIPKRHKKTSMLTFDAWKNFTMYVFSSMLRICD